MPDGTERPPLHHRAFPAFLVILLTISPASLLSKSTHERNDSTGTNRFCVLAADGADFFHDAGRIFTSPLRFESGDWLATGAVLGTTALLLISDVPVRKLSERNQSAPADGLFSVGESYGQYKYGLGISGAVYAGGLIFGSRDVRETGLMLIESIVYAGAVTSVIKVAAGRSRPFAEEGNLRFHGFEFRDIYNSLPSGHVTVAFAVSSVLSARLKNTWASIGLFSLAALDVGSRLYHEDHWVSDTFLGGAVGMSIGLAVAHIHEEDGQQTSLRILPALGGLRAELKF
jgi:membrane-associated phospholipid phosphatase